MWTLTGTEPNFSSIVICGKVVSVSAWRFRQPVDSNPVQTDLESQIAHTWSTVPLRGSSYQLNDILINIEYRHSRAMSQIAKQWVIRPLSSERLCAVVERPSFRVKLGNWGAKARFAASTRYYLSLMQSSLTFAQRVSFYALWVFEENWPVYDIRRVDPLGVAHAVV